MNGKYHWAICSCCEGEGRVENPAFSNGFTSTEWAEMDGDEQQRYLSGAYDVACTECKGSGKVQVPNVSALSFAEKRALVTKRRADEARRDYAAEVAAERRHMGYC